MIVNYRYKYLLCTKLRIINTKRNIHISLLLIYIERLKCKPSTWVIAWVSCARDQPHNPLLWHNDTFAPPIYVLYALYIIQPLIVITNVLTLNIYSFTLAISIIILLRFRTFQFYDRYVHYSSFTILDTNHILRHSGC